MPVRRTKLLAGAAALLGLSLGGAGCHWNTCNSACCPGEVPSGCAATPAPVTGFQPAPAAAIAPPMAALQRPVHRPLFSSAPEATAVASARYASPPASVLRPVPAGAVTGRDNTWSSVQRVSAEGPGVPVETGRVMPAGPVALLAPPTVQEPGTLPAPAEAKPMEKGPEDVKAAAPPPKKNGEKTNDVLPAPKKRPDYPELPPVGITHPVTAPREFEKRSLSAYIIEPPDVLAIDAPADLLTADKSVVLSGPALVRPDGTIGLGTLGSVFVAGMTIDQAKERIARVVQTQRPNDDLDVIMRKIKVDVAAFNSKFYYVISDGAGYGEQVVKVPITGNETVLDAVASIQGLPAVASKKKIWLARATPNGSGPHVLPIDWCGVAMRGSGGTNYQIFPGDRLYIQSDRLLAFNSALGKVLAPVERILGVTLLGSSVVNSIKSGGNNN